MSQDKSIIANLKKKYRYDHVSGKFYRIKGYGAYEKGSEVKTETGKGYISLSVMGKNMRAHRAAFLLIHGYIPGMIDHIDNDRKNNKIDNLREATPTQNAANIKKTKGRSSEYKGVSKTKSGKFLVSIRGAEGPQYLGVFECELTAAAAYNRAAEELHGEFAAINDTVNHDDYGDEIAYAAKDREEKRSRILKAINDDYIYNKSTDEIYKKVKSRHISVGGHRMRRKYFVNYITGGAKKYKTQKVNYDLNSEDGALHFICDFRESKRYNPDTGCFMGIAQENAEVEGSLCVDGYVRISFKGKTYMAHRVAYLITYFEWPEIVDHINGDKSDNRIANLRAATSSENARNRASRGGTSKHKGVSYRPDRRKWAATIGDKRIGSYATESEAARAYDKRAKELHGEFARLNFTT